jgi:hypothetical protein
LIVSSIRGGIDKSSQNFYWLTTHDHTLNVSAPGVLSGSSDPNHIHLTSVLVSGPSSGSLILNSDGSFSFTPSAHFQGSVGFSFKGYDGNQYSMSASDTINVTDTPPTASIPIHISQQLFNVPLAYDSVLAQPDAVIEADVGLSSASPVSDTLSAALTFNGVAQPAVYFNMNSFGKGWDMPGLLHLFSNSASGVPTGIS